MLPWTKWRIDSLTGLGVDGDERTPLPLLHLQQTLGAERPDGLADDGAGDAELVSQLALGRKRVARLELSRRDHLEDRIRDLVRQTRLAVDRLEDCGEAFAVGFGGDGPNLAGCAEPVDRLI